MLYVDDKVKVAGKNLHDRSGRAGPDLPVVLTQDCARPQGAELKTHWVMAKRSIQPAPAAFDAARGNAALLKLKL